MNDFLFNRFMFNNRNHWIGTAGRLLLGMTTPREIAGKGQRVKPILLALAEMIEVGLVEQHGDHYRLADRYVFTNDDGNLVVTWPEEARHERRSSGRSAHAGDNRDPRPPG